MSAARRYLPHIILGLSISLIMVGAYAAVGFASSSNPKALWSTNPVSIQFTATGVGSSGSVGVSFKCAPAVNNVFLTTSVSSPSKVQLTVNPQTQSSCGPPFDSETVTATCLVAATLCKGSYTGTVTVHRTTAYGNTIPPSLTVNIVVS